MSVVVKSWPTRLALFLLAAILFRLPTLLWTELNLDESLYRLMADSLVHGHAPYLDIWDRKPVGVFVILALVQEIFGNGILPVRLAASLAIGLSAFLLCEIARALFPDLRRIGLLAGALVIVYSLRNGGQGANTEHFFVPLSLAGFLILLHRPRLPGACAAGLLLGAALQVKYSAVFDILAVAIIIFLIALRARRPPREIVRTAAAVAAGIVLPTLAVLACYAAIGHFADFAAANFTANAALVGETAPGFNLAGFLDRLRENDAITLGAIAAFLGAPFLADTASRRAGLLATGIWLLAMAAGQVFLRRFADHFFIEVLPPLALAAAFCFAAAAAKWLRPRAATAALAGLCLLLAAWVGRVPYSAAAETLARRHDIPHWGDRTATVAAELLPRLHPGDTIYVPGNALGIYLATGRAPPTRFAFAEHLWSAYAPVDGRAEMARILATRPAFVVVDDTALPAPVPPRAGRDEVLTELQTALAADYVLDHGVGRFISRGGGAIGGGTGIVIYRRRDLPAG